MFGLSPDEIAALLSGEFEKFSAREQALLRLADALVGAPVNVSDELYAEAPQAFLRRATDRACGRRSAGKLPGTLEPRVRCWQRRVVLRDSEKVSQRGCGRRTRAASILCTKGV